MEAPTRTPYQEDHSFDFLQDTDPNLLKNFLFSVNIGRGILNLERTLLRNAQTHRLFLGMYPYLDEEDLLSFSKISQADGYVFDEVSTISYWLSYDKYRQRHGQDSEVAEEKVRYIRFGANGKKDLPEFNAIPFFDRRYLTPTESSHSRRKQGMADGMRVLAGVVGLRADRRNSPLDRVDGAAEMVIRALQLTELEQEVAKELV